MRRYALFLAAATAVLVFLLHSSSHGMRNDRLPTEIAWKPLLGIGALALASFVPLGIAAIIPIYSVRGMISKYRARRSLCLHCGYADTAFDPCPECGRTPRKPPPSTCLRTMFTYLLFSLALAAPAIALSESLVRLDERRFRQEAAAAAVAGDTRYHRDRVYPNTTSTLCWDAERGFWCTD